MSTHALSMRTQSLRCPHIRVYACAHPRVSVALLFQKQLIQFIKGFYFFLKHFPQVNFNLIRPKPTLGFRIPTSLVANPCDARERYQFFPNDLTLAIGIEHQFSSSTFLFFNFIYFMSSTKYSMDSLYLKNVEVQILFFSSS